MSKELNIGDYVRTKKGIAKIKRFCGTQDDIKFYEVDKNGTHQPTDAFINFIFENEIIKSSPNIIDLIEVGDYVNGYKVMGFKNEYIAIDNEIDDFVEKRGKFIVLGNEEGHYGVPAEGIKSIVTREMFESMEYKIGE